MKRSPIMRPNLRNIGLLRVYRIRSKVLNYLKEIPDFRFWSYYLFRKSRMISDYESKSKKLDNLAFYLLVKALFRIIYVPMIKTAIWKVIEVALILLNPIMFGYVIV